MTHNEHGRGAGDDIDASLRWSLRALRRDIEPGRDLWPQIGARIAAIPQHRVGKDAGRRGHAALALAASVLLALGVAWQWRAARPQDRTIAIEARAMTLEYRAALRTVVASARTDPLAADPAARELDRSAAQIRTALTRDPDARFLLDRLRHTYSLRLALTRRAAFT